MKIKSKYINGRCQKYKISSIIIFFLTFLLLFQTGCKKLVEVEVPVTFLNGSNVYADDGTAASVLTGIYAQCSNNNYFSGTSGISMLTGLSADELTLWSGGFNNGVLQRFYQNNLLAQSPPNFWQRYYGILLIVNSAIEGIEASSSLTPVVKKQLLGEAYFLRAFFHFYLVNFYGDVPLAVTSDWRVNGVTGRTPAVQVYDQIVADLKEAQNLLSGQYLQGNALTAYNPGSEERVRPTKWAATALLARIYLYQQEWSNAEAQASTVIDNTALYSLSTLSNAFKRGNNPEAIWQMQYVNTGFGTEGYHFILTELPGFTRPTYLSSSLVSTFETGDNRKTNWMGTYTSGADTYYYPYKYKAQSNPGNTEHLMILRLAEQFLIRSEARAQQDKISDSKIDLNTIRARAGLIPVVTTDKVALLDTIMHERQVELFTEWGHRWLDLKRTDKIDMVMSSVYPLKKNGGTWDTNWQLYPLSFTDIQLNPNLAPNNLGY